ncbi:N-acetylneuraminate 9-O-acetyltransferase-like 2, partial [Homarus americanus]
MTNRSIILPPASCRYIQYINTVNRMRSAKILVTFTIVVAVVVIFNYGAIEKHDVQKQIPRNMKNEHQTCRDIFEIGSRSKKMSNMTDLLVKVISRKKKKREFLPELFYEVAAQESPSMIRDHVHDGSGLQGTNLTLAKEWRFEQAKGQLPYLACQMREFRAEDLHTCVRRRSEVLGSTHITYVGDSRVRQHVEVLLDLIRDLQPKITTHQGDVLTVEKFLGEEGSKHWKKYKYNFRVECARAEGLIIDFHWAALIDKSEKPHTKMEDVKIGALQLFHRWLNAPKELLPDLIILNTGAWQLLDIRPTVLKQIDESAVQVMTTIRPLLKSLATRTTVVWALPDPFKEHISHDFGHTGHYTQQTSSILEWLLYAQIALQPNEVITWDSFLPVAHSSKIDCMQFAAENINVHLLPMFSTFPSLVSWHCTERMHVGLEALTVAVQMVLNHEVTNKMAEVPIMSSAEVVATKTSFITQPYSTPLFLDTKLKQLFKGTRRSTFFSLPNLARSQCNIVEPEDSDVQTMNLKY